MKTEHSNAKVIGRLLIIIWFSFMYHNLGCEAVKSPLLHRLQLDNEMLLHKNTHCMQICICTLWLASETRLQRAMDALNSLRCWLTFCYNAYQCMQLQCYLSVQLQCCMMSLCVHAATCRCTINALPVLLTTTLASPHWRSLWLAFIIVKCISQYSSLALLVYFYKLTTIRPFNQIAIILFKFIGDAWYCIHLLGLHNMV